MNKWKTGVTGLAAALLMAGATNKAVAPEMVFAEAETLDLRSHRPVEHEKALLQEGGQFGGAVGLHGGLPWKKALENEKTRSASKRTGFGKIVESRPL